jgi:hypothetical protein
MSFFGGVKDSEQFAAVKFAVASNRCAERTFVVWNMTLGTDDTLPCS